MPYRTVFDVVWSGRRHMMMMASQIDRTGQPEHLGHRRPHAKPKVQLVGVRGAPGNSVNHPTSYWVPDHTVRTFVEQVDVVSGVGYARAAAAGAGATRFHDIRRVVSNLGVFDFETPDHTMRLRSHHPGVTVDEIVAATGFALTVPDDVAETRLPTPEELELIRTVLDPRLAPRPRGEALSTDGTAPLHPALHTELCERIGVRYPLVQTGMGWVAGPRLVAATTEAGGLGILASATMTLDELAAAIAEVRQRTSGPFGVNLRTDVADVHERIELMIETGARVASFAQAPNPALVTRCKEAGLFVMPTVGARRHAEKVAEWGVDAVIAQGGEGGGHTGTVPTTLLLPQVVDAVGDRVPGPRGRRLLQRAGPGGRPGLRRRRRRHGHPLPALGREPGARRRQGALPRHAGHGHRGHHQGRRRAPAGRAHRPGRPPGVTVLAALVAPRAAQRLPVPPGDGRHLRLPARARGGP